MQNEGVVRSYKKKWTNFITKITDSKDFHFMMYPRKFRLEERMSDLTKDFASDSLDMARYYTKETVDILEQRLDEVTKYDFILGVKLQSEKLHLNKELSDNVKTLFANITDTVVNLMGWEQNVPSSFFDQFSDVEDQIYKEVASVKGDRLEKHEMVYMNRYHFLRGNKHDVEMESKYDDLESVTNTIIDPTSPAVLGLTTDQGEMFTTFIVVNEFENNMADTDIFYEVQSLPFPVELQIKASAESRSQTRMKAEIMKKQLKETSNERNNVGDQAEMSTIESSGMINNLLEETKNESVALFNWLAVIAVYGRTDKEAKTKARSVKGMLHDRGIKTTIPLSDQLSVFYKMLPGQKLDVIGSNWLQKTTQDGLAENAFGVSNQIGNNVGFHIGWIDSYSVNPNLETAISASREPVLFYPFLANQKVKGSKFKTPHILISGDSGNGKSFLAKLIFIEASMLDIKLLYIDPKKEIKKWISKVMKNPDIEKDYPLFVDHLRKFHFTTLDSSDPNNWGVIDPISFLNATQAKNMIMDMFQQIYDFKGKDYVSTHFLKAIKTVTDRKMNGETVGTMHVIYEMQNHEDNEIVIVGDYLYEMINDSILKLAVHDGSNDSLSLKDRINIVEIENLELPDQNTDYAQYTFSQLRSNAVLLALGKYCELFGANKDERTMEFMDEAWIFTNTPQGDKIQRSMRRVGRSFNNALVFISQSTSDALKEDDSNNFGVAFAFDEPTEREKILKWMNMEITKDNEDLLDDMYSGQCLFKDIYNRTAKISIECLFEEWVGALETVEVRDVAKAEEKYA